MLCRNGRQHLIIEMDKGDMSKWTQKGRKEQRQRQRGNACQPSMFVAQGNKGRRDLSYSWYMTSEVKYRDEYSATGACRIHVD